MQDIKPMSLNDFMGFLDHGKWKHTTSYTINAQINTIAPAFGDMRLAIGVAYVQSTLADFTITYAHPFVFDCENNDFEAAFVQILEPCVTDSGLHIYLDDGEIYDPCDFLHKFPVRFTSVNWEQIAEGIHGLGAGDYYG